MDNYLQKLNINENLKKEINSYRESYPVSKELLYRIPKPDNLYYGDEIWNQAVTALLCGENILLVGHKATGKNIFAENKKNGSICVIAAALVMASITGSSFWKT